MDQSQGGRLWLSRKAVVLRRGAPFGCAEWVVVVGGAQAARVVHLSAHRAQPVGQVPADGIGLALEVLPAQLLAPPTHVPAGSAVVYPGSQPLGKSTCRVQGEVGDYPVEGPGALLAFQDVVPVVRVDVRLARRFVYLRQPLQGIVGVSALRLSASVFVDLKPRHRLHTVVGDRTIVGLGHTITRSWFFQTSGCDQEVTHSLETAVEWRGRHKRTWRTREERYDNQAVYRQPWPH